MAARGDHFSSLQLLLDTGADIEALDFVNYLFPRFIRITSYSKLQLSFVCCITILLLSHFDSFQNGDTALMISAFYGHVEVVALLCKRGANIEARDHVCMYAHHFVYLWIFFYNKRHYSA